MPRRFCPSPWEWSAFSMPRLWAFTLSGEGWLPRQHSIRSTLQNRLDRLLSNGKVHIWRLFQPWIEFVIGPRKELVVAMDWTEFDADDQATICLYLITRHGRATPLVWHSVYKSTLEGKRNAYEDEVLECLRDALSDDVQVCILADR